MGATALSFDQKPAKDLQASTELGRALVDHGLCSTQRVIATERQLRRHHIPVSEGLRISLRLCARDVAKVEAAQYNTGTIDPLSDPPDPRLLRDFGVLPALDAGILPWRRMGRDTIVLTHRPGEFDQHRPSLEARFGHVRMSLAPKAEIEGAIINAASAELTHKAETLTPPEQSCRAWTPYAAPAGILLIVLACALFVFAPKVTLYALFGWTILTFIAAQSLRVIAGIAALTARPRAVGNIEAARLPIVTLLVPLYRETEIAAQLVSRLGRINYPAELLDVCLMLEDNDHLTSRALNDANLPRWMRQITVPHGTLRTKPRALNFGLKFARGSIIGVYDAEDAPDPNQIRAVAKRFAALPSNVACLQGVLDYYNSSSNFLARYFTIEYATWFRMVLPGLARMGLVLPLGGTTLFFRRSALEEMGGWDAHNVTEDADLGVRLARMGYRTELINSVTLEEANCRLIPWIKQRSRWLKGYAMTYGNHMRDPARLWRELGAKRFLGFQVLFLGTLSQFALAPLMWSFWGMALGFPHPLDGTMPSWGPWAIGAVFLGFEVANITLSAITVTRADKRDLIRWTPLGMIYFPFATLSLYKGLWEVFFRPFYWDKTSHGVFQLRNTP